MRSTYWAAGIIVSIVGCSNAPTADIEPTVPVSGIATYQGKPLEGYKVTFSNMGNRSASAMIDAEGRFSLGTNAPGDGAPEGKHFVSLVYSPVIESEPGNEAIDPVIPPPKVKIPEKFGDPMKSGITVEVPPEGLTDYKLELE